MTSSTTKERTLGAPVLNAGTFDMPYPPGESRATGYSASGHVLADDNGNVYTSGFTVAFGASVVTVTNASLGTLAAGRKFRLELNKESPVVVSASRSLTDDDDGKTLEYSGAGAITLTVPEGLMENFGCAVVQLGAGVITFAASGAAALENIGGLFDSAGQYATAAIVAVGVDSYVLTGSLA